MRALFAVDVVVMSGVGKESLVPKGCGTAGGPWAFVGMPPSRLSDLPARPAQYDMVVANNSVLLPLADSRNWHSLWFAGRDNMFIYYIYGTRF